MALADENGRLIVAECRRRRDPVKLTDLDAFARRVELLRQETGREVAGVYFTKTAYQEGVVKAAQDSAIDIATCAQDQPLSAFSLVFHRFDPDRGRRLRQGEVQAEGSVRLRGRCRYRLSAVMAPLRTWGVLANFAVDRTAGSHSLAAAGHRGR